MNEYQRNQMKAAGFVPPREVVLTTRTGFGEFTFKTTREETMAEWVQRMIEQGRSVDVLTLDSCSEIDWDAYERTRQHCKETERE